MDNFSYTPSYPDSATSTPRSLETAFENHPPWDDHHHTPPPHNNKVKFLCSYGGKILPKPHDNHQLSYIGGDTKIIAVERNIKFDSLVPKLASLCDEYEGVLIKYQLPDEDLDALISVTNDDDLDNMLHEYDRLCRASNKPARLRLFLFPPSGGGAGSGGLTSAPASKPAQIDKDDLLLLELEKDLAVPPPVKQPREEEVKIPAVVSDQILKHIEDLQRLKLEEQQGLLYRTRSDDGLGGGTFSRPNVTGAGPGPVGSRQEKPLPGGGRVYQTTSLSREQPVFMLSQPAPVMRPVAVTEPGFLYRGGELTDAVNQGYYGVQRMPPPPPHVQPVATAPPSVLQPQGPSKVGPVRYTEGINMVRTPSGVQYPQMVYDNLVGRQVYYNGPGGQVKAGPPRTQPASAPQYQPIAAEMRPVAGMLNHGGGVAFVPKATQGGSV